jgi:Spy/CpxP family protein refolding chaperone
MMMAALAALIALPAFAQGPRGRGPGGGGSRVEFLAGYLSLTDAQKTQAQAIFEAASAALETARGQAQSAHDAIRAAVKANAADAEFDRLGAALGAVQGQMAAIQGKADAKFYAILTAEQKEKYDSMASRGPGPMGAGPRL